jgi:hypothetical protein
LDPVFIAGGWGGSSVDHQVYLGNEGISHVELHRIRQPGGLAPGGHRRDGQPAAARVSGVFRCLGKNCPVSWFVSFSCGVSLLVAPAQRLAFRLLIECGARTQALYEQARLSRWYEMGVALGRCVLCVLC